MTLHIASLRHLPPDPEFLFGTIGCAVHDYTSMSILWMEHETGRRHNGKCLQALRYVCRVQPPMVSTRGHNFGWASKRES